MMARAAVAAAPEMAPLARLHALAKQLARPVARGWLTLTEAHVALLVAACHTDLGDLRFTDFVRGTQYSLHLTLENEHVRRDLATHCIRRTLAPMIAQRKPKRALLAEAHGVNGEAAFPLSEGEVEDVAAGEVWWATKRARNG
jgi:hypothetical protein